MIPRFEESPDGGEPPQSADGFRRDPYWEDQLLDLAATLAPEAEPDSSLGAFDLTSKFDY